MSTIATLAAAVSIPSPSIAAEHHGASDSRIAVLADRFAQVAAEARTVWQAKKAADLAYLDAKRVPAALLWREGDPVPRGGWVTGRNGCTGEVMCDFAAIEATPGCANWRNPRLREIVVAYDEYRGDCDRLRRDLDLDALADRLDELVSDKNAIIAELVSLHASSPASLRAKAVVQAQQNVPYEEFQHLWGGANDDAYGLLRSIQADLTGVGSLAA